MVGHEFQHCLRPTNAASTGGDYLWPPECLVDSKGGGSGGEINQLIKGADQGTPSLVKEARRRRMTSSGGDPLSSSVCLKKKRAELVQKDQGWRSSVLGRPAGYGKISVIGRWREMEDAVAVELGFLDRGERIYDFFGVYDGHGGWRVAQACSQMLHKLLAMAVEEETSTGEGHIDWEKVMVAGFQKMDTEVNKNGAEVATMGSTAAVAVVGENEVVVANCGDSRVVLSRGGVAVQLSDDHKPDRPDELNRIEVCGGKVLNWNGQRVLRLLATSRSIGDHYLKPYVITEPEVKIITKSHLDECLILASDGLWDVISNDLACQVTRRCLNGHMRRSCPSVSRVIGGGSEESDNIETMKSHEGDAAAEAATLLAELALARGSRDNISVVVVELKGTRCGRGSPSSFS